MPRNKTPERIIELERALASTQAAAEMIADELMSIIVPYCTGNYDATAIAIKRVAARHVIGAYLEKAVH